MVIEAKWPKAFKHMDTRVLAVSMLVDFTMTIISITMIIMTQMSLTIVEG